MGETKAVMLKQLDCDILGARHALLTVIDASWIETAGVFSVSFPTHELFRPIFTCA